MEHTAPPAHVLRDLQALLVHQARLTHLLLQPDRANQWHQQIQLRLSVLAIRHLHQSHRLHLALRMGPQCLR